MDTTPIQSAEAGRPWWREPEVAILIVLVAAAYFVRVGDVSMRGEETRRAQVAFEMMDTGDWIVPREQGDPFLSRPPLQNWLIAASAAIFGSREPWVVRLHSVLAMLFTTIFIYGYARTCLSRLGALTAAAAFATLGEMFEIGYQAETEMLLIALVAAALLLWHWGQVRNWPPMRTWIISYALVALGVLCKGPQPPIYFVSAVTVYLLVTGQVRQLFTRAHWAGALVGVAIVLAWAIPCAMMTSWSEMKAIVLNDSTSRFMDWTVLSVSLHVLRYPLEVLGSTLPWSLLLFAFAAPECRRLLGFARPQVLFMALCMALAFPTCWIPPGGQTRYFAPLYPCMAVLAGMVVECCIRADVPIALQNGWRRYTQTITALMLIVGLSALLGPIVLAGHAQFTPYAERLPIALGYALATLVLARLVYQGRKGGDAKRIRTAVLGLACFMVLTSTGILKNIRIRRGEDQAGPMACLLERLPEGHRLVSFGHIDSAFAYYYGQPIPAAPIPTAADEQLAEDDVFFCFNQEGDARPALPFPWDEWAVISMDRNHHARPERAVVVGRARRCNPP